jgi:hypothetical protein
VAYDAIQGNTVRMLSSIKSSARTTREAERYAAAFNEPPEVPAIRLTNTWPGDDRAGIVDTDYQDCSAPISVGDIVAINVDNYEWPEYAISLALVVDVRPDAQAEAGRGGRGRRNKRWTSWRKEEATRGWNWEAAEEAERRAVQ